MEYTSGGDVPPVGDPEKHAWASEPSAGTRWFLIFASCFLLFLVVRAVIHRSTPRRERELSERLQAVRLQQQEELERAQARAAADAAERAARAEALQPVGEPTGIRRRRRGDGRVLGSAGAGLGAGAGAGAGTGSSAGAATGSTAAAAAAAGVAAARRHEPRRGRSVAYGGPAHPTGSSSADAALSAFTPSRARSTTPPHRQVVEEQDRAYEAALRMDQERERRLEAEMEASIEAERVRVLAQEERQLRKSVALSRLPPAHDHTVPNAFAVSVRLPAGARVARRFVASDPVQTLVDWLEVNIPDDHCMTSLELSSSYPSRVLFPPPEGVEEADWLAQPLDSVGIASRTALLLREAAPVRSRTET